VWDRSARPGVSIQLAARANAVLDVGSGDMVVVTTHLQKVGRTLGTPSGTASQHVTPWTRYPGLGWFAGFLRLSIRDERGNLLVTGTHIKFMPMGALFDVGLHPLLQPLTIPVWEKLLDLQALVPPWGNNHGTTGTHGTQGTQATQGEPAGLGSIERVFALRHARPGVAEIDLRVHHANPIGGLHGGAGAMLCAHAALGCLNPNLNQDGDGSRELRVGKGPQEARGTSHLTLQELTLNLLSVIPAPSSTVVDIHSSVVTDEPRARGSAATEYSNARGVAEAACRVETSVTYGGKVALESSARFAPSY
jgi:hypothetical protein